MNITTVFTGQSASGKQVSGTDRILAGASVVPADAVVGIIVGAGSKLLEALRAVSAAREARLRQLVDILHAASTAKEAEKLAYEEAFRKAAPCPVLAAEARRLYELARDVDTAGIKFDEAKAALRLETQLGKRLFRPLEKGGEDFRIGSQNGTGIDFWGTMTRDQWNKQPAGDQLESLLEKLNNRKGLIGVDLSNAPSSVVEQYWQWYLNLTPSQQGRIIRIK